MELALLVWALRAASRAGGLSQEELRKQDERLKRIREVSADFLSALKNT